MTEYKISHLSISTMLLCFSSGNTSAETDYIGEFFGLLLNFVDVCSCIALRPSGIILTESDLVVKHFDTVLNLAPFIAIELHQSGYE